MKYYEFERAMAPFVCFSVNDARVRFPGFDRKRLTEWQQKGYIRKIVRGFYRFAAQEELPYTAWFIANRIYAPSYISLQSALAHYGFIPEAVFHPTSIATRVTRTFESGDRQYIYRNIKPACYFGFTLLPYREHHTVRLAEPEKALLDLLYLEPALRENTDFEAWRLEPERIRDTVRQTRMDEYSSIMMNNSFTARYRQFKRWLYA